MNAVGRLRRTRKTPVSRSTQQNMHIGDNVGAGLRGPHLHMAVSNATKPTTRRIFERLSGGADAIERKNVASYLKGLGIGGGLFGGAKIDKGVDEFMDRFDTAPADNKVTWDEFVGGARHLLPPGLADEDDKLDASKVDQVFESMAPGKTKASAEDVVGYVKPQITGAAAMFAHTIADAAARIAVDALDTDGDGAFTKKDLRGLVDDVNAKL